MQEARILELVELGEMIQTFFGCPQDIERCFSNGRFHIVQSRVITTLYPLPGSRGSFSSYTQWGPMLQEAVQIYRKNDSGIIDNYIQRQKKLLEEWQKRLSSLSGKPLLQVLINDQEQLGAALYDAAGFGYDGIWRLQHPLQRRPY